MALGPGGRTRNWHQPLALACTVLPDTSVADVGRRAAERPYTLVVCVVDEARRLQGLIPIGTLLECLLARAAPERLHAPGAGPRSGAEVARLITVRTAEDLMQAPVSTSGGEAGNVEITLRLMCSHRLLALPVVDEEGCVLGLIDALEVLLRSL
jgi:CBS domain-containing protein